jgi:hypothetical protein
VLLCFGEIAERQIEFAEMFVRAAMARIKHQRLLAMLRCRPQLTQAAMGIADVVPDIGVTSTSVARIPVQHASYCPMIVGSV